MRKGISNFQGGATVSHNTPKGNQIRPRSCTNFDYFYGVRRTTHEIYRHKIMLSVFKSVVMKLRETVEYKGQASISGLYTYIIKFLPAIVSLLLIQGTATYHFCDLQDKILNFIPAHILNDTHTYIYIIL
jgi:hypothetical protein